MKDTVTLKPGGNILIETDMVINVGDPLILFNKYDNYPIMEDKWVVRKVK